MLDVPHYPLTAVVGQENVKRALSIALVNPNAGGLLISGKCGMAKSVLVRATSSFTPTGRIVELPLGASEDMVFGSIDVETALQRGERRLRHGILQRAHNTVLYMDEVNLLREDILAAVLSCAADGMFHLERDGLSFTEITSYTPVGTMDPAEGTLRPTLLDSFGMFVSMDAVEDILQRREIAVRALEYERAPLRFRESYAIQEAEFGAMIISARDRLPLVKVPPAIMRFAAACALRAYCVGNRADIYLVEAARAIAALAGRDYVMPADVEEAAVYVLAHRMSSPPEEQHPMPPDEGDNANPPMDDMNNTQGGLPQPTGDDITEGGADEEQDGADESGSSSDDTPSMNNNDDERVDTPLENVMASLSLLNVTMNVSGGKSGKRDIIQTHTIDGRCLRTELPRSGERLDLALSATLRAAAPYQRQRQGEQAVIIHPEDVRTWVRAKRSAVNIIFLVDASGSMGANVRMRTVKGAILALLQEAYQKRDCVGLIVFRRDRAEMILPVTRSVELAEKKLRDLPTGGRTPLAEGLGFALQTLHDLERRGNNKNILVVVTDGRPNMRRDGDDGIQRALRAAEAIAETQTLCIVLDTERSMPRIGVAPDIARHMEASYYTLEQLSTESVLKIVHASRVIN